MTLVVGSRLANNTAMFPFGDVGLAKVSEQINLRKCEFSRNLLETDHHSDTTGSCRCDRCDSRCSHNRWYR